MMIMIRSMTVAMVIDLLHIEPTENVHLFP